MSSDFTQQLDALRQLSTMLGAKQDVPPELWQKAGVTAGTRLKDVNNLIVSTKKKISAQSKEVDVAEEEEDGEGAKKPKKKATNEGRKEGRDKKMSTLATHRGDFDLETDRMFVGGDGAVHHVK